MWKQYQPSHNIELVLPIVIDIKVLYALDSAHQMLVQRKIEGDITIPFKCFFIVKK